MAEKKIKMAVKNQDGVWWTISSTVIHTTKKPFSGFVNFFFANLSIKKILFGSLSFDKMAATFEVTSETCIF
jgi:hypothetical protein